ncbi:hypothetical protein B0H14DRAFT_2638857 [Mycena olivaceomarginata]|nr:hypothetical protein B0H14DRAFT_2638857 [Mycena olivaceomarginata]
MFPKHSLVFTWVLIASSPRAADTLAAASPHNAPPPPPSSPQCCKRVVSSISVTSSAVAGRLGIDLTGLNVPIGLSCSPITVVGNCGGTTVTCDAPQKQWSGAIAINCLPITQLPELVSLLASHRTTGFREAASRRDWVFLALLDGDGADGCYNSKAEGDGEDIEMHGAVPLRKYHADHNLTQGSDIADERLWFEKWGILEP